MWIYLGNILIAGSSNSGDVLREITAECGFEVDEEGAAVIDHLNYDVLDQGKVQFLSNLSRNVLYRFFFLAHNYCCRHCQPY